MLRLPLGMGGNAVTQALGSLPGVLLVVARAWLLPSPGLLLSLRKTELREACEDGEEEEHMRSLVLLRRP